MTFFCEETIGANEYHLYKDGKLYKTVTKNKQKPANKAEFSFPTWKGCTNCVVRGVKK